MKIKQISLFLFAVFLAIMVLYPASVLAIRILGVAPSPVSEPAAMLLLGTGLIGMAGIGRKRFKK